MSDITIRKFTDNEDPATIQSAIECLIASFSMNESNMAVCDNNIEILSLFYTLSVQRAVLSTEPGEAYLAVDESAKKDGLSKVVGIATWRGPKENTEGKAEESESGMDFYQPLWDMMPVVLATWWKEEMMPTKEALFASSIGEEALNAAWHLECLCVHPDYQKKGIASRLMAPVVSKAAKEGRNMTLETGQETTVRMYEHMGFQVMGKDSLSPPDRGTWPRWTMLAKPQRDGPEEGLCVKNLRSL